MPKYRVYSTMYASVYLGEVEAEDEQEAKNLGGDLEPPNVSLCHQCGGEGEGVYDITVYPES